MESKFYLGQKVVAINSHREGYFKEGDEFTILGIEKICCNTLVKIFEAKNIYKAMICDCGNIHETSFYYFNENRFAPIQEVSAFTYSEALELVTETALIFTPL